MLAMARGRGRRSGHPAARRAVDGLGPADRRASSTGIVAQIAAEASPSSRSSSSPATALGVATDVAVVVQGRIVAAGKPDDLPDDLADAYLGGAAA